MSEISLATTVIDDIKKRVESYITEKKKDILSNIVIALAVVKLEDIENEDDQTILIQNNNYFCIKANKKYNDPIIIGTSKYRKFKTIEDNIEAICNTLNGIKGIVSVDLAVNTLSIPEKMKKRLIEIIESYHLNDESTATVIDDIVSNNTVEVDNTDATSNIIDSTIPKEKQTTTKATKNSFIINNKIKENVALKVKSLPPSNQNKIKLIKANLFDSPTSGTPARVIDGYYFLVDNKRPQNNRYAIVMKPQFIGDKNMVIGWVNKNEIIFNV